MLKATYSKTLAKDKQSVGFDALTAALFAQRNRFDLWCPVWLGLGIGAYFALAREPTVLELAVGGVACLAAVALIFRAKGVVRVSAWVPLVICIGFLVANARGHLVAAPKLGWHYYGPVEGTIAHLDRSGSDKPRITLIDPVLAKTGPDRTPKKLRVALHGALGISEMAPGARVMLTASLSPPAGPVEPGGFDFQRKSWFDGLGATGYSRTPVLLAAPSETDTLALQLFALRMRISDHIRSQIEGQTGAFAAAIITGDRSQIDPALMQDLRASNLAHLLAISGLHMGLLTGFVFAIIRLSIAAVPYLAVRWQGKKTGAVVALMAGLSYLAISGANVATQRAFVMVAVMLVAVLLDRPAITLRAVALAATLILLLRPESLTEPGFQMSFAATTALVATFEALNRAVWWQKFRTGRVRAVEPVLALLIASAVAGGATAPFSAFHFNQTAQYGLLANLLSVPVMGVFVMPFAVIAGVFSLIGLERIPFQVMGAGIDWILYVAHLIAGMEGSVVRIPSTTPLVLGLFTSSALFFILWLGRFRWVGLLGIFVSLAFWSQSKRPEILITDNGRLVGIATPKGRALNHQKGNGFAAKTWLENDGDFASQSYAAKRGAFGGNGWSHKIGAQTVAYQWGKKLSVETLEKSCREAEILIVPQWDKAIDGPCRKVTRNSLRDGGAIGIWATPQGLKIENARQRSGTRLWNR